MFIKSINDQPPTSTRLYCVIAWLSWGRPNALTTEHEEARSLYDELTEAGWRAMLFTLEGNSYHYDEKGKLQFKLSDMKDVIRNFKIPESEITNLIRYALHS